MRYQRSIFNAIYVQHNYDMIYIKIELQKYLQSIVKNLKIDDEPGDCMFGARNKFIRKLTDYLFRIIEEGTVLLGNGTLFNELK